MKGELKKIEPMDYRYLGSIFRGPLTEVIQSDIARCGDLLEQLRAAGEELNGGQRLGDLKVNS